MNIYHIDADIRALIDEDTGEISDYAEFERLCALKGDAIEEQAIIYKQLLSDEAAIEAEIKRLTDRKNAAHKSAERIKFMLANTLGGESHKTPRISISWRASESTQISDEASFIRWAVNAAPQYLTFAEPKVCKTAIKDALKAGEAVEGAWIERKNYIQIK